MNTFQPEQIVHVAWRSASAHGGLISDVGRVLGVDSGGRLRVSGIADEEPFLPSPSIDHGSGRTVRAADFDEIMAYRIRNAEDIKAGCDKSNVLEGSAYWDGWLGCLHSIKNQGLDGAGRQ